MNISIVTAFSEPCLILAHRFLISCYQAALKCSHDFTIYCYKCNYNYSKKKSDFFQNEICLPTLSGVKINVIESAEMEWTSKLPDIAVYDHFSNNFMNKYSYSLFCHDDVVLKEQNVFDEMITTLQTADWENRPYDLIAGLSANAIEFLSIRFHPCFLFIPTKTFVDRKLSFVYSTAMGEIEKFWWYNHENDGGAPLLASYYSKKNSNLKVPFTQIHGKWFDHIKAGLFGMEFSRLTGTEKSVYENKLKEAQNEAQNCTHNFEMKKF